MSNYVKYPLDPQLDSSLKTSIRSTFTPRLIKPSLAITLISWSLSLVLMTLFSCAEPVKDINRVQPHYMKKSMLDGQWYLRQTIVDRPPQFAYLFTGIEGALEKVEWEVRERQLIARRVYEVAPGLDDRANQPGGEYKGSPVAIFPIITHFDIMRQFNTSTGEQSNVIMENYTLNPWYEREYMRVDWSMNMVESPIDLSGMLMLNPYTQTPANRQWVREDDPDDPDRWQVTDDFIFITSQYSIHDGGYSCYLNYASPSAGDLSCGAVEVKLRHAFLRVNEEDTAQFEAKNYLDRELITDEDDEALTYTQISAGPEREALVEAACTPELLEAFQGEVLPSDCQELKWDHHGRFGYFRTRRNTYDRKVGGAHDSNRIYHANHHQIWEQTIDAEGQGIPLDRRQLKPIIYYLSPHFPEDLKLTAIKLSQDWNTAFMKAASLATRKSTEELRASLALRHEKSGERAVFLIDIDGEEIGYDALFQLRENTCSQRGIDQFLRAYPEYEEHITDLRREDGDEEILLGQLKTACSRLNFYSVKADLEDPFIWQQMGDPRFSFLWWVREDQPNGPLGYGPSSADPENGRLISGNAYIYGGALDRMARSSADLVRAVNGDLCSEFGLPEGDITCALDGDDFKAWFERGVESTSSMPEISENFQRMISQRLGLNPQAQGTFDTESSGDQAPATDLSHVLRDLRRRLHHPNPSDPMQRLFEVPINRTKSILEAIKASPSFRQRMTPPEVIDLMRPLFQLGPDDEPTEALLDLALEFTVDPQRIQKRLDERARFYAEHNVMLPEGLDDSVIGQAMALKDLSPDEIYQILRREIFEAVALHEIGHTVGLRHNFQASFDALNYHDEFWEIREESAPEEWDQERLPEYRYASIMDYGSRFNSDTKGLGRYDYAAINYVYGNYVEVFEDQVNVPTGFKQRLEMNDYSKIPELLGSREAIKERIHRPVQEVIAERRTGVLQNARLLIEDRDQSASQFWSDRTVPYAFCSDEYRGDLKCRTWDEGANHSEAVKAAVDRYWQFYFFDAFRRGRNEISFLNRFFGRMGRLGEYLTYPWQFYSFYDAYEVDVRQDLLRASVMGLNFLNQVMGTPTPGYYCRQDSTNFYFPREYLREEGRGECDVYIPHGEGRDMWIDFSDDYIYQIDYIGTYYDKMNLFRNFVSSFTRFFRITDYTDTRAFSINYYRGFKDELLKMVRDMAYSALPVHYSNSVINYPEIYSNRGSTFHFRLGEDGRPHPEPMIQSGVEALTPQVGPEALPDPEEPFQGSDRIFAYIPYNMVWQGTALAAIFNTSRYDQETDFIEYISIQEAGSGDDRAVSEDRDEVRFTDPTTGITYLATQTLDGLSISHEILSIANEFKEGPWQRAYDLVQASPDNSDYISQFNSRDYYLQQFIELMNDFRFIRSFVDFAQ